MTKGNRQGSKKYDNAVAAASKPLCGSRKKATFRPKESTAATLHLAQLIILRGDPNYLWRKRRWAAFVEFCGLNNFDPIGEFFLAIPTYAAQHEEHGTAPTSLLTYLRAIRRAYDELTRPEIAYEAVVRGMARAAALYVPRHARDFDVAVLTRIVTDMYEAGYQHHSFIAFTILSFGLRFSDLKEVQHQWVSWGMHDERLAIVEVHLAKNIKSTQGFTQLRVPLEWMPQAPSDFLSAFARWLRAGVGSLAQEITLHDFNAWIKVHSPTGGGTSYSFRRNFMHRLLARLTNKNGIPNYKECAKYSLHHDEKMLKSAYEKRISEIPTASPAQADDEEDEEEEED